MGFSENPLLRAPEPGKKPPLPPPAPAPVLQRENLPHRLLEPRSVGEILDHAMALFKENYKPFFIASLIFYLPSVVMSSIVTFTKEDNLGTNPEFACFYGCGMFLLALLLVVVTNIFLGISIVMARDCYLGYKPDVKTAFNYVIQHLGALLVTLILYMLILGGLLFGGGIFLTGAIFAASSANILACVILALLAIPFFVIMLYFMASYGLYYQMVLIEEVSATDALSRSNELFRSSWESIAKVCLVPFLITVFLDLFSTVPYAGYFLMVFVAPLGGIATTVLYYDILIHTEGFDLEHRIDTYLQATSSSYGGSR